MPDEKKDTPNEYLEKKHRVPPVEFESDGNNYSLMVDKVGYHWNFNGESGFSPRIRITLVKLDEYGYPRGGRKQLNLPSDIPVEKLKELMNNIAAIKDKKLPSED